MTKKKPTSIKDDWHPGADAMLRLKDKFPTVDRELELERFKDFHLAKGSQFVDWVAALRTWYRNAIKFGEYPEPQTLKGPEMQGVLIDEAPEHKEQLEGQQSFLERNNLT